jgi:DNA-binding transcriptional MerR regulator
MHSLLELFNDYDQILNRGFSVKDLKVPYRNINHWDEKGLLLNTKREDGQWRKFNFMDCIWIRIVSELRNFGVSFPKIITLKEILIEKVPFQTHDESKGDIDYYNVLMLLLVETIISRSPISILLQTSGETFLYNAQQQNEYGAHYRKFVRSPHISISLPYIFCQFIIKNDIGLFKEKLPIITKDEQEVLTKLRSYSVCELTLQSSTDGSTQIIHAGQELGAQPSQVQFILSMFSNDFETVAYSTTDGKSVKFNTQATAYSNSINGFN